MSGLVTVYGEGRIVETLEMLGAIKHRGSAGQWVGDLEIPPVAIGYRWSSSEGEKDNFYVTGDAVIALDGQLFGGDNGGSWDRRLRAQELLSLYQRLGTRFFSGLKGMFALCMDLSGQELLVARDRLGIKPLYWGRKGQAFYFASEIKALVNECEEIEVFPPGHYFHPQEGLVPFSLEEKYPPPPSSWQEACFRLRSVLQEAVARCLPERGKVGIFLSGGLDSSIVAAVARGLGTEIESIAVGYHGSPDLEYARLVARWLGLKHHEYVYGAREIEDVLPKVIYHLESFDWSLVRSAVPNYLAARLARQEGLDYVLVGEGSDELFGGYHYLKGKSREKQRQEMVRLLKTAHTMGLQRVDRMTSAFGLTGILPFLDYKVVGLAASLPLEWKISRDGVEKWILREAFRSELPSEIVDRQKEEFSQGAGSAGLMAEMVADAISDEEFAAESRVTPEVTLRSKEELYYYRIFKEFYPQPELARLVGRWTPH
ncbi:MAG: asparagine synthase-related protein [Thermanaeromonas sp.]|uniref:asparagine synthase-related protein n=1 Tax=Thermanaeromonas sp. TaxID=2003697 RepID=UPI00243D530B|nr:asparagine synthase-related protein [Thermanaeromonas sp.]MCG0278086.1 asparagine synthase-related protein [Thermanaeromonas sp.]